MITSREYKVFYRQNGGGVQEKVFTQDSQNPNKVIVKKALRFARKKKAEGNEIVSIDKFESHRYENALELDTDFDKGDLIQASDKLADVLERDAANYGINLADNEPLSKRYRAFRHIQDESGVEHD